MSHDLLKEKGLAYLMCIFEYFSRSTLDWLMNGRLQDFDNIFVLFMNMERMFWCWDFKFLKVDENYKKNINNRCYDSKWPVKIKIMPCFNTDASLFRVYKKSEFKGPANNSRQAPLTFGVTVLCATLWLQEMPCEPGVWEYSWGEEDVACCLD